VNHSEGPFVEACEPARLISIFVFLNKLNPLQISSAAELVRALLDDILDDRER
jgi:hypothetical protein